MAYDSATDTALAGQAYQRALTLAQQQRDRLNQQFGLNADGSLNNTPSGNLGTIYQAGLAGEQGYEQAARADRSRGFAGTGGLAGRGQARARQGAIDNQAAALQDATGQLGAVGQSEQGAQQDYQSELGNIGRRSAFDLANTLVANPVLAPAPVAPTPGAIPPALAAARAAALKKNPRAAQTARNMY